MRTTEKNPKESGPLVLSPRIYKLAFRCHLCRKAQQLEIGVGEEHTDFRPRTRPRYTCGTDAEKRPGDLL